MDGLIDTIASLRAPDGCPWDREQTHASIAKNMLEEAYEAVQAIEEGDSEHLREELGDVLLQVVLQSQIAADAGEFTIDDVAADEDAKMIRRHPHVFGVQKAFEAAGLRPDEIQTGGDVESMWDQIKAHEKLLKAQSQAARRKAAGLDPERPAGLLDDVPRAQPALAQAQDISRKAVSAGFEWESTEDVWAQVRSEIEEYREAPTGSDEAVLEMGDILFSLVNVARREGIDAETALRRTCEKFRYRWGIMEDEAHNEGTAISEVDMEHKEALWRVAKAREREGLR